MDPLSAHHQAGRSSRSINLAPGPANKKRSQQIADQPLVAADPLITISNTISGVSV
jgi:hypothetical protein